MEKTGQLCEIETEVKFEWKIKDFSQLSDEIDVRYVSSKFHFCGTSWEIWIYPNGQAVNKSGGWTSLFLARMSPGFPLNVDYSFSLKSTDKYAGTYKRVFDENNPVWGMNYFIMKTALVEIMSKFAPSDVLTIICTLKSNERIDTDGSLFCRFQEMSDDFKELYAKGRMTDFVLKVGEQSIGAHRLVLATRSAYFAAMLSHDTKENQTGEVSIPDIDNSTMETILSYMYTGDVDELTTENALSLCVAADKYDIKGLKDISLKFILKSLSVAWVLDVIKFTEIYQDEEVSRQARHYFKENVDEILKTEQWKALQKENPDLGFELLGSLVKELLPKKKNSHKSIK